MLQTISVLLSFCVVYGSSNVQVNIHTLRWRLSAGTDNRVDRVSRTELTDLAQLIELAA